MPRIPAVDRLHLHGADLPHPAVGMLGRASTRQAIPGDMRHGSANRSWKLHWFARGVFHWRIGDELLELGPRSWLVTPPDVAHGGVDRVRESGEFYWCHLLFENAQPLPGLDVGESRHLREHLADLAGPPLAALADRTPLWQRWLQAARARDVWRAARFRAVFLELVFALLADAQGPGEMLASAPIRRAIEWLRLNLEQPLTVADLAARAGLGRSRFCDRFRAETGMSPTEYRQRLRIEEAKRLLADPDQSVTDLALTLGYASSQSFATAFRRATGRSPTAWRKP